MATPTYFDADRYDAGDDSILAYPADVHLEEIFGSNVAERRLYRATARTAGAASVPTATKPTAPKCA